MKKHFYTLALGIITLASCTQKTTTNTTTTTGQLPEHQSLSEEAIRIHDEIMPMIGTFDRTTVKIDSILESGIDEQKKVELTTLKTNLEAATDNMMTWMRDYVADSTDIAYQKAEIERMTAMKKQFDDAAAESKAKLEVK